MQQEVIENNPDWERPDWEHPEFSGQAPLRQSMDLPPMSQRNGISEEQTSKGFNASSNASGPAVGHALYPNYGQANFSDQYGYQGVQHAPELFPVSGINQNQANTNQASQGNFETQFAGFDSQAYRNNLTTENSNQTFEAEEPFQRNGYCQPNEVETCDYDDNSTTLCFGSGYEGESLALVSEPAPGDPFSAQQDFDENRDGNALEYDYTSNRDVSSSVVESQTSNRNNQGESFQIGDPTQSISFGEANPQTMNSTKSLRTNLDYINNPEERPVDCDRVESGDSVEAPVQVFNWQEEQEGIDSSRKLASQVPEVNEAIHREKLQTNTWIESESDNWSSSKISAPSVQQYADAPIKSTPLETKLFASGNNSPTSDFSRFDVWRHRVGRPPAATLAWGFGGRLLFTKPQFCDLCSKTKIEISEALNSVYDTGLDGSRMDRCNCSSLSGIVKMTSPEFVLPSLLACTRQFPGPMLELDPHSQPSLIDNVCSFLRNRLEDVACEDKKAERMILWNSLLLIVGEFFNFESRNSDLEHFINWLLEEKGTSPLSVETEPSPSSESGSKVDHSQGEAANEIELLLSRGDCENAVARAIEGRLWAQALIISNHLSISAYRRVVSAYIEANVGGQNDSNFILKLMAGSGIEALATRNLSLQNTENIVKKEKDSGFLWKRKLAAILSNSCANRQSLLTALGDRIWHENGNVIAAHCCYLLAGVPPSSMKNSRLLLVGVDHRDRNHSFDFDSIQLTELYLWTQKLRNPGLEANFFQPFRLLYAMSLADLGDIESASRWCQSINNAIGLSDRNFRKTVIFPNEFRSMIQSFMDRLISSFGHLAGSLDEGLITGVGTSKVSSEDSVIQHGFRTDNPSIESVSGTVNLSPDHANQPLPEIGNDNLPIDSGFSLKPPSQDLSESSAAVVEQQSDTGNHGNNLNSAVSDAKTLPSEKSPNIEKVKQQTFNREREPKHEHSKKPTKSSGGFLGRIKTRLIQKLVPVGDAHIVKETPAMEAWYCKERKRWIFPGEEDKESAPPSAPPKISQSKPKIETKSKDENAETDSKNDPMAALIAPPQYHARNMRKGTAQSARRSMSSQPPPINPSNFKGFGPAPTPNLSSSNGQIAN